MFGIVDIVMWQGLITGWVIVANSSKKGVGAAAKQMLKHVSNVT